MYEQLAVSMVLEYLRGTFFIAPVFRSSGVKIGKGYFINTTNVTEFDLVSIRDYVVLNYQVELQTHLFEDRIMKVGTVCVPIRRDISGNNRTYESI